MLGRCKNVRELQEVREALRVSEVLRIREVLRGHGNDKGLGKC